MKCKGHRSRKKHHGIPTSMLALGIDVRLRGNLPGEEVKNIHEESPRKKGGSDM